MTLTRGMLTFQTYNLRFNDQVNQPNLVPGSCVSYVKGDLMIHQSVEIMFINVAIGTVCHPFSKGEGGGIGYGLGPGCFLTFLRCLL